MPNKASKIDGWTRFTVFQYYGFFFIGRYFSFLAGPLIALLAFNGVICRRIYHALTRNDSLTLVTWVLLISILDGIWETIYGVLLGYNPVTALEILVFNLCPIYLYLGMWAGSHRPTLLRTFIRFNAWFSAANTVLYYGIFRHFHSDFLGAPGSGSSILLGLFCLEGNLAAFWFPILCASFNMIANQVRSDWAGFFVALIIWAVATRRVGRFLAMNGLVLAFLIVGFVFDFRMPAVEGRGDELSARDTVGRALSVFDPRLAREYSSNAAVYAGTIQWRETWWKEIRGEVHKDIGTAVFGLGYGYPLADLVPYLKGSDLRTPHSILYFTLSYSGYTGLAIFLLLQGSIIFLHWRNFRERGKVFGLVLHVSILTGSLFGNLLEAPQMAIPCYILFGMALGPLFDETRMTDEATTNHAFSREFSNYLDVAEGHGHAALPLSEGLTSQ